MSGVADRRLAYVLDASALLAMLQEEPGGAEVALLLENSVISSVNWSEVVQKLATRGLPVQGMRSDLEALGLVVLAFDSEDAECAAKLWATTRSSGLSLGDRACLALATRLEVPALTVDRAWGEVQTGVEVQLLR